MLMDFYNFYSNKIHTLRVRLVGEVEKQEDRKWRKYGKVKGQKKFQFSHKCLVGEMEEWKDIKVFCLVEKKYKRIESRVCINLLLCPYQIKQKITHYIFIRKLCMNEHIMQPKRKKHKKFNKPSQKKKTLLRKEMNTKKKKKSKK